MPTTCAFQLDRHQPIYNSGDYVSGRIVLRTDRPKRVNSVFVTLQGEAKVQWSISCKTETVNYFGHQQYLYTRANVYERGGNFRAGTHVYALSLRIPNDCPSSCKGPYGHIAYTISLTITKPWSLDEVFHKQILVVQTLDLNVNPEYALPVTDENIKYLCRWPCRSGPICSTLVLPSSGYMPTQHVSYLLEVDNQSPHYDVAGVEAALKQHFVFLARKPLKRNFHSKTLAMSVIEEGTLRLTKRLYEGSVRVPAATPRSTLDSNYIVFLHYTLEVRIRTGCLHYDTTISAPLVIGTVPLQRQNILVTTQPTTRSRRDDVRMVASTSVVGPRWRHAANRSDVAGVEAVAAEISDGNADDDDEDADGVADEPPPYDSCLPPSFSYATLGSQQTLERTNASSPAPPQSLPGEKRVREQIIWPQLPDYRIYASSTQVYEGLSRDALLQDSSLSQCKSYGSLDTDRTGCSLATFSSSCDILSEENASEVESVN